MQEIGHIPITKTITFAAGLALAQNAPHVALEMLTSTNRQNYVTVRNLKVNFFFFITIEFIINCI